MPFRVERLHLHNFRNFELLDLSLDPGLTVLVGANGAGKTSVIEALQIACAAFSFRKSRWADVVRWDCDSASIAMTARDGCRTREVKAAIGSSGRNSFQVNGTVRRKTSDVAGVMPCVVFTPEDLAMVKGPSESRRSAIDEIGDQLSAQYATLRIEYARVLRQRNAALRAETATEELPAIDELLVEIGGRLTAHRARLATRLAEEASKTYKVLSPGETLTAEFVPSWSRRQRIPWDGDAMEAAAALSTALDAARAEEQARQITTVGPHRDDVAFGIGGRDARTFGSQGQQRTVALAWKLAEVEVIESVSQNPPLLLLDDVMSELDEDRRHALAGLVRGRTQTVVTTTNRQYFSEELLGTARVVEVRRGV